MTIYVKRSRVDYSAPKDHDWVLDGKCRGVYGLFHADKSNNADVQRAKSICNGTYDAETGSWTDLPCPVKQQCLNEAIHNNEKYGVWGGQSERDRRRTRRHNAIKTRAPRRTPDA